MPRNNASALGEAVGKVFEEAVRNALRGTVESRGYTIRPARLVNGTGNEYQIDAVVYDQSERPLIIVDPKYIRYTKHNRDKGSWLCVAHYNLRKTFPTIRKSIAVLAGRWSAPSRALIRSFGVELIEVPFQHMVGVLRKHGVKFDWEENEGNAVAANSLPVFESLSDSDKQQIGQELLTHVAGHLQNQVATVLETDVTSLGSRISEVEVLLKTNQGEMVLSSHSQVTEAVQALMGLVADKPNIWADRQ